MEGRLTAAPLRRCSKCLAEKPAAEFKTDRRKPGGLSSVCKPCSRAAAKVWRKANVAHVTAYAAEHGKGRVRVRKPGVKPRKRSEAELAERRVYNKAWEQANPGKVRAGWANKRAKRAAAAGSYTADDVARILKQQRGRCAYCRRRVGDGYHVDHIVPLAKGGTNWPRNLQIVCAPCNGAKHASDPIAFARKSGFLL